MRPLLPFTSGLPLLTSFAPGDVPWQATLPLSVLWLMVALIYLGLSMRFDTLCENHRHAEVLHALGKVRDDASLVDLPEVQRAAVAMVSTMRPDPEQVKNGKGPASSEDPSLEVGDAGK